MGSVAAGQVVARGHDAGERTRGRAPDAVMAVLAGLAVIAALLVPLGGAVASTLTQQVTGQVSVPAGVDPASVVVTPWRWVEPVTAPVAEPGYWSEENEREVALTSAGGVHQYALSLPEGRWVIQVHDYQASVNAVFHPAASSLAAATPVVVTDGPRALSAVTLTLFSSIGGLVSVPAGHSPAGVQVHAFPVVAGKVATEAAGSAGTDEDGAYRILQLPPGSYRLQFVPSEAGVASGWWAGAGAPPAESAAAATNVVLAHSTDLDEIDAVLQTGGTVTGKVTDLSGRTVGTGVEVRAYEAWTNPWDGTGPDPGPGTQFWRVVGTVVNPAADGTFRLTGLPPGSYRVGVEDPTGLWSTVFHPASPTKEGATDVVVHAGRTTAGIVLKVDRAGSVRGTVTVPATVDPTDVCVTLHQRDASGRWVALEDVTFLEVDGTYSFPAVASGVYRVGFADARKVAEPLFHPAAATLALAKDVTVGSGSYDVVVNATMTLPGAKPTPSATPTPAPVPTPKITVRTSPRIKGTAKVGRTVRVTRGTYRPATVTVKYRWYLRSASGKVVRIKSATKSKLKLKKSWAGRKVRVRVSVTRPGHRSLVVTTKWSKKVAR